MGVVGAEGIVQTSPGYEAKRTQLLSVLSNQENKGVIVCHMRDHEAFCGSTHHWLAVNPHGMLRLLRVKKSSHVDNPINSHSVA